MYSGRGACTRDPDIHAELAIPPLPHLPLAMTGPPTPPPTTEAEIQDAARTSIPPQVTPMATDPEPPITVDQPSDVQQTASTSAAPTELQGTPFEILLSTLADLADVGQYRELVLAAEQGDALVCLQANSAFQKV